LVDGQVFETEISCQFSDNQGGFWLGTLNKGLLYYHPGRFKFRNIGRSFFDIKNESLTITCLADKDGKILAGTNSGVFVYSTDEIPIKKYERIPPNVKCNNMFRDSKNRIWICTQVDGLFCIADHKVTQFRFPFICQNLFETEGHDFYLATSQGFGRFSSETGEFSQIEVSSGLGIIFELLPFPGNKLLGVLYGDAGLFIYDIDKNSISTPDSIDYSFLRHSNKKYHDIFADHRGLIWFGTQDGLNIYNQKTGNSRRFYETDGLVNNNIRSIVEDNEGRIWLSTSSGITCISVEQGNTDFEYSFANFNQYDGIIKNEFLPRSVCLTSDNRLLWGGEDGFNIFDLNRIASSDQEPGLPLLTGLSISGNKIRVAEKYDGTLILKNSLSLTKEIRLKHFQNFIGFEFSALNYVNPSQTIYRYQLEGIDKNWNEIRSDNGIGRINYTNLPHGTYQLKVQAAINGNHWGEKYSSLAMIIRPPYWKTSLAYLLYGITILLILYSSAMLLNKRKKEKLEIKRVKDLEEIKLGFYTNVSHELRTPLTLIITPLESILRGQISEPLKEQLSSIHRNAKNLLDLVNQLLDFRKIEMSYETIQLSYCQIDEFLENIVQSFSETAKEKNIHLNFIASEKNIYEKIDREKFRKIIYNLLSNALKFTPSGGKVSVTIDKEASQSGLNPKIVIKVTDTGCGIPEKELPKIFDHFYQVSQDTSATGSGIGLFLVREYIQMHNGTVSVKSQLNEGSTFILEIPCQSEDTVKRASDEGIHSSDAKILIVEDNIQFREFLCNEISKYYDVVSVADGKDGLAKAREEQPSLVISDVMMPELSGIELCHQLKNDLEISHIPVILLSANSSDEYQNEGFKAKADAYIAKPFNLEILLLRIQNLIELQENRRSSLRKEIHVNPGEVTNSSIDEKLLKSVIDHINNNLENSSYSIDQLSREMFMDRTGLYRKIKAISGQTPSEFVRSIRLKKAAQLLENGMPVAEVCGKVGFATVSYFSKCFQAEFGCKPSHFRNKHL
jgi:signal transduction histidine kinase/DNA-binding response OmpR family regulator/outer membrane protein assembly factor BamB